ERIISIKLEKELAEQQGGHKEEGLTPSKEESYESEKPKTGKKERPVKPVRASMPRRWGSCIIFLALVISIIAGVFLFPSYKNKITPYALDVIAKIKNIYQKQFGTPTDKPVIQDKSSRDITITLKSGRKLFWSNYFEEGDNYCTNESYGKLCVPKDDVVSIKDAKK
ncbi:MAG: hypothetical protein HYR78_03645, partial [Nitrospirae bacterium]|nr:hypothetical protein [Nitrospirota bacterium]